MRIDDYSEGHPDLDGLEPTDRLLDIPRRSELDTVDSDGDAFINDKVLKAYRKEMGRARKEASLPLQEELGATAVSICMMILQDWQERCVCPGTGLTEEEKKKTFKGLKGTALCQACKRLRWILGTWTELERIMLERQKIDYGLLKLSERRRTRVEKPEAQTAVQIVNQYHADRLGSVDGKIIDVEPKPNS